jgi:hypothetical protein
MKIGFLGDTFNLLDYTNEAKSECKIFTTYKQIQESETK